MDMMMMEIHRRFTSDSWQRKQEWLQGLNASTLKRITTGNTSRCLMLFLFLSVRYSSSTTFLDVREKHTAGHFFEIDTSLHICGRMASSSSPFQRVTNSRTRTFLGRFAPCLQGNNNNNNIKRKKKTCSFIFFVEIYIF
jgi:hypothetical protein